MQAERKTFYQPEEISQRVKEKVRQAEEKGEPVDFLSFVPDGEPTLDINLGKEIELVKSLGIRTAVLTNASLLWHEDVRQDLTKADWVSLKVDTVSEGTWNRINRPHKLLDFETILEGMLEFADTYEGTLAIESMLVQGINDNAGEIERLVDFAAELNPDIAYLAIPTRPPAVKTVTAASEQFVNMAYQIFSNRLSRVECLTGYEGNAFAFTGNARDDLLSITSVHPMREDAVGEFLTRAGAGLDVIEDLLGSRNLVQLEHQGKKFYIRKFPPLTLQ
jgi:wyosine [tRNA(Phe)-imidazoG37] synthetase (radical SAM superfamily)